MRKLTLKLKANSCKTNQQAVRVCHPKGLVQKLVFRSLNVFVSRNFELRRKLFHSSQFYFVRRFHLNLEFLLRASLPQYQLVLQKIVALLLFELLQAKLEKFELSRRFAVNFNFKYVVVVFKTCKRVTFGICKKQY